ncbi:uncharacterized protein B0I36DRAFT_244680 [Microdochium trichocladiopsis]|uniref:HAUS augmin-like complex subunit 1 n=1 Tax=Microdochium trichocladiopsis TaxID=1682393 RepID=A0A9P9BM96_9PEZI|nr:uncharacterized protein B0I36DRAFT_244680 [Microdochium trichocladiopsis]KAH7029378.1 hypothetical protein B0I36DRAFT_244680 [Microdochium trichocladiopsis]
MAHRRLQQEHALQNQPPIFSPSVARAAASTAKDWAYVDSWLKQKYSTTAVPPFERNAETLRMLLALVAANEAADEDRDQLARAEEAALQEVRSATAAKETVVEDLLCAIEDNLTKEGRAALDSMAGMAVELGVAAGSDHPNTESGITPELLAARFIELQASAVEVDRATARVEVLHEYVRHETARLAELMGSMHGQHVTGSADENETNVYALDPEMARLNTDTHIKITKMEGQLPQLEQQVTALNKMSQMPTVTVDEVKEDEDEYLRVLARKKDLDAQLKAFAGLPPDVDAARAELENLRNELRSLTDRRDNNFERLVERESPAKPRRRMP